MAQVGVDAEEISVFRVRSCRGKPGVIDESESPIQLVIGSSLPMRRNQASSKHGNLRHAAAACFSP